jgi:hypothetical protein
VVPPTANVTPSEVEKIVNDAIKANPSLTAEDVQKIVSDAVNTMPNLTADQVKQIVGTEVSKLPVGASPSDVQKTVDAAKAELTKAIENVSAGAASGNADLQKSIDALKAAGLTSADVQKIVDASAANQSEATKQTIADATRGLASTGALEAAKNDLAKEIQAAKDIGLEGDAAIQAGLDSLAGKVGTNQADLLTRLGTTAADLKTQFATDIAASQTATAQEIANTKTALEAAIADAKASGLQGDAALRAAIESVAADQQTSIGGVQSQIAAAEEARKADVAAQLAREEAARQAAAQAARQAAVKTTLGQGQQALQSISQQLPQALRQAQTTTTPIYGEMGPYLDLGSPLDFGFFKPSAEKQAATKQQQPTKIATGGYIDDPQAGDMSVDDLLNLLR